MTIPASDQIGGLDDGNAGVAAVHGPAGGGPIALPAASYITDGQFLRSGGDLVVGDGAGHQVIVPGYFAVEHAPVLTSPDGSLVLTPTLVSAFLTPMAPGQYAQAAPVAALSPVGQVLDLEGNAFAVHADGTRIQLAKGDAIHEGDIIETGGAGSAIRMIFTDKTEFSLGADARLSLDQLIFNPDSQSGSAQFSVLKGVFIFASGQIAKTDNTDMTVITPVATIGIRGTEVAGRVSASDSQFTVIHGAIEVTTQAGSVTLDDSGETTHVAGYDAVPSDPVVLTAAQFGQAYGDVAGVLSGYFNQGAPGTPPLQPGDLPDPVPSPNDPGDRADSGAGHSGGATGTGNASSFEAGHTPVLAATLADEPTIAALSTSPLTNAFAAGSSAAGGTSAAHLGGPTSDMPSSAAAIAIAAANATDPVSVQAVPGLDFAGNLTFSSPPSASAAVSTGGVHLFPSGNGAPPNADVAQVAFVPGAGGAVQAGPAVSTAEQDVSSAPPAEHHSSGSSSSPFRSETGSGSGFAANPYITTPFGYSGPELGDPVFNLVSGESSSSGGSASDGTGSRDVEAVAPASQSVEASPPAATSNPSPVEISLVVSNATIAGQYQDLTHQYELPNEGPASFVLVHGAEMGIPGVPSNAEISLQRDVGGNVDVTLNSAWDSVKNIRAESDTAADVTIRNFVHADVSFGDGGDSHITIQDAKRGFILTGNGNDTIAIDAYSNGPGWSHAFDVQSGAGNDLVIFNESPDGLSHLTFDGGAGTDTLRLSGAGTFRLAAGEVELTGVERVDISGPGNTTLMVTSNVFDPTDTTVNALTGTSRTIVVDGDAGDTLDLHDSGWSQVGTTEIEGHGYTVYEHASGMRVAADADIHVT